MTESQARTEKVQVFAVLRYDNDIDDPLEAVTVKEILPTMEEAEAEVARLNNLKAHEGSRYAWQTTRYYPRGRGAESRGSGHGP